MSRARRLRAGVTVALAVALAVPALPSGASTRHVPSHYLFTPNFSANVVTVWDGDTYRRVATLRMPYDVAHPRAHRGPTLVYATPDGKHVMLQDGLTPDVETIDVKTLSFVRSTTLPGTLVAGDRGAAIPRDSKLFWVSTIGDQNLFAIDIATGAVVRSFPGKAQLFANSMDGKVIYKAGANGGLEVLDSRDLHLIGGLAATTGQRLSVSPDDKTLYLQTGVFPTPGRKTEYVEVVDVSRRAHPRLVKRIPLPGTSWPAALSPDGRQLWVTGNDQPWVRVIDTRSLRVLATIDTGYAGGGVAVSKQGKAYVTVLPEPFAPMTGVSGWHSYFGGIPAALLPVDSDTTRPIDAPGEVYVYSTKTFKRLRTPRIVLPSLSWNAAVVDNVPR